MGRPDCSDRILSGTALSKTNPTWTAVWLNHGFCYQKPATDRPSNKTANVCLHPQSRAQTLSTAPRDVTIKPVNRKRRVANEGVSEICLPRN